MPSMLSKDDIRRRRSAVKGAKGAARNSFTELVKLARLDPAQDLRFSDFAGVSFKGQKLDGFDFTGCILHGCNFDGASIAKANFSQAELGRIIHLVDDAEAEASIANVSSKSDVSEAIVTSWRSGEACIYDRHLSDGAVFQDAWFSPQSIVVRLNDSRFAVGRMPITNFEWATVVGVTTDQDVLKPKVAFKDVIVDDFLPRLNSRLEVETKYAYRLLSMEEGNFLFKTISNVLSSMEDYSHSPYGLFVHKIVQEGLDAGLDATLNFHTKWLAAERNTLAFRVIRQLQD